MKNKIKKSASIDIIELAKKHTFAICAYKESVYLEDCIKSVLGQTLKSNYLIVTSTPSEFIENIAKKYNIRYEVRKAESDIQEDWNFAIRCANTKLVTLVHQDDLYEKNYLENVLKRYEKDNVIYFTDYWPLKKNKKVNDVNSRIKRIIKVFLRSKKLSKVKFFKIMSLSFGNTINCPSVTYNKELINGDVFTSNLKFSLDWDTFLKLAKTNFGFAYIPKKLVCYRIYDGSTTKKYIQSHKREVEDMLMFNKIWPKFISKIIMKVYKLTYKIYD